MDFTTEQEAEIASYDQSLTKYPEDIATHFQKAQNLLALDREEEALATYDEIITIAYLHKGQILRKLRKYEAAVAAYTKLIEHKPDHNKALNSFNSLGECLMDLGRFKEAVKAYDDEIKLNPEHNWAYENKGFALYQLGELEQAVKCFDKQIEFSPNSWMINAKKGKALYDLNNVTEGMEHIQKAVDALNKGTLVGNVFTDADGSQGVLNVLEVKLIKDIKKLLAG